MSNSGSSSDDEEEENFGNPMGASGYDDHDEDHESKDSYADDGDQDDDDDDEVITTGLGADHNESFCSTATSDSGGMGPDPAETIAECSQMFAENDFVMEPVVLPTLKRYCLAGGDPQKAVVTLANNYHAQAQICNTLGDWLLALGDAPESVRGIFEKTVATLVSKNFNSRLADRIFDSQADGTGIDWLPELINHAPWRSLIYTLAEQHVDTLMLNFAVKLISDAGYQHEISSVTTAAQQLEIFSRVLTMAMDAVLAEHRKDPNTESYDSAVAELVRVASHGEHTHFYAQALLQSLINQSTSGQVSAAFAHMAELLRSAVYAQKTTEISPLTVALISSSYSSTSCAPVDTSLCAALWSMVSKKQLNPADMTDLYKHYAEPNGTPPPVDIIREPIFVDMLIAALFKPKGKINPEHREKYIYILAYAACVSETVNGDTRTQSRNDLSLVRKTLDEMSLFCQERSGGNISMLSTETVLLELEKIFSAIENFPVVTVGLLYWIEITVTEPDYFKLHPQPVPIHLAILDEIGRSNHLLHSRIFELLRQLFSSDIVGGEESRSTAELAIERQKMLIDRMVHLLSLGFALPVTEFVAKAYASGQADISLVRYFASETLEIVSSPYSQDFIDVFMPIVANQEIFDESVHAKLPSARDFLQHCSAIENEMLTEDNINSMEEGKT